MTSGEGVDDILSSIECRCAGKQPAVANRILDERPTRHILQVSLRGEWNLTVVGMQLHSYFL